MLGAKATRAVKVIDYDDPKVKGRWKKISDRQREELETDVLAITQPRAKLDAIAKAALETLCLIKSDYQTKEYGLNKSVTPDDLEKQVLAYIVKKGIASEVKKVTDRLNARRMTDARRWVLATTYGLAKLFQDKAGRETLYKAARDKVSALESQLHQAQNQKELEELVEDDLGVAEKIMLDLEEEGGPLDVFANLIVKSVIERNRIKQSNTFIGLVSQQVRSAI